MTKSEALGYPLMMLVAGVLMMWAAISAFRTDLPSSIDIWQQISGLALLVLGFVLAGVLDALARRRAARSSARITRVDSLSPTFIHEVVHLYLAEPGRKASDQHQWEVTSAALVGHDNSLALAKLRIDLEQTLRRLALAHNVDLSRPGAGVNKVAMVLADNEVLPTALIEPIRQIVSVCNQAIHGGEISDDLAESIVSVGNDLVSRLRVLIDVAGESTLGTAIVDR